VYSFSCGRMNWRDDSPSLGSCPLRKSNFGNSDSPATNPPTGGSAKVEGKGFGVVSPGCLDHFLGAGEPCDGVREEDGFGPRRRFWVREICGFCLRGTGPVWTSALTAGFCGSGFAHFEIGGAHFPIPAGVDDVSGDGGAVGLVLEKPHPVGWALTCVKQYISVRSDCACLQMDVCAYRPFGRCHVRPDLDATGERKNVATATPVHGRETNGDFCKLLF